MNIGDLTELLHAERSEKNTRHVDCWACEAAGSPSIKAILALLPSEDDAKALAESATRLGHALGRAEALALRCGCAVWPEHTLSHHARKEDS